MSKEVEDETAGGPQTPPGRERGVWLGLGSIAMMGWMIVVPPVVGAFVGHWIDTKWPTPISWTMILMLVGLVAGCYNVWAWVERHMEATKRDNKDADDK
jgi:ATP synthase protein I